MVANLSNAVTGLTTEDIQSIYAARIDNWSVLGGANLPIVTYALNSNHGTSEVFRPDPIEARCLPVDFYTNARGEFSFRQSTRKHTT